MTQIPAYVISLPKRIDRRQHIIKQFQERSEFTLTITDAVEHEIGSWGLWLSIRNIVEIAKREQLPYVLICEDDHTFTRHYKRDKFLKQVKRISQSNIDFLCGGVSWFDYGVPITPDLIWLNHFNATQFVLVFDRFYHKILSLNIAKGENPDLRLAKTSDNIICCYPFISIQSEFGYSDVTHTNSKTNYVTELFEVNQRRIASLMSVYSHFRSHDHI